MGESEIERAKTEYLQRLRHQLRRVPASLRKDAIHEVQAHIEDGCRQSPDDPAALHAVLERLGPPEEYGHDLGLQLLLQANRAHPSLNLLIWTGIFWASTSVVGAFVIVGAVLVYVLGLAFVVDGLVRLISPSAHLTMIRFNDSVLIPAWWPPLNMLTGILILYGLTYALIFLVRRWSLGKLSRRGLVVTLNRESIVLPKGWERRASVAIIMAAIMGFLGCSIFGAIGGLLPIGRSGPMSLPQDFFKNPFTFIAFLGMMVFLLSPVLGILWAARREQGKKPPDENQASNTAK
jgi:hypothetical protein